MKKSTEDIVCLIILEVFLLIIILPITSFSRKLYIGRNVFGNLFLAIILILVIVLPVIIWEKYKKSKSIFNYENLPEKIDPRFNVLYLELHYKHIEELEILRKKTRVSDFITKVVFIMAAIGFLYSRIEFDYTYTIVIIISSWIAMIVGFITLKINEKNKKKYSKLYKQKVITNFVDSLKQEIVYDSEDYMQENEIEYLYRKSGFESEVFNIFEADDHISGKIEEDIEMKLADISVKYETNNGEEKKTVVRFQGLYIVTNCNSYFKAPIKIVKNGVPIMKNRKRVELDNDEFERYFDIYAEDKILAVRLLTHDVMECLLNFYKKYGIKYEIILDKSFINIRLHTGPMFEPKIYESSMDRNLLYAYYLILKFVIDLTKKINKEMQDFQV